MSSGAQDDSSQQPAADRSSRRRNSFSRALDRFKTAFTRRGSNKAVPTTSGSNAPIAQTTTVPGPAVEDAGVASASTLPTGATTEVQTVAPVALEPPLEVQESALDDFDDSEEPILPVDIGATRTGLSEEKAKALFERYGLRYAAAKRAQSEPPSKIRRVERPIRIRLHWTCEHCKTSFGHEKVCTSCGHSRCGDCVRSPPQRVLRLLEKSKQDKELQEIHEHAANASPEDDTVPGLSTTVLTEKVPVAPQPEASSATAQPTHEIHSKARPLRFIYTIHPAYLGGRVGGIELYQQKPGQPQERKPGVPAPTVQRVFKQPRQRVRWTCDRCDSLFIQRDTCSNCHHQKCEDCIRQP